MATVNGEVFETLKRLGFFDGKDLSYFKKKALKFFNEIAGDEYNFDPNFICDNGYTILYKALIYIKFKTFVSLIIMGASLTNIGGGGKRNLLGSCCINIEKYLQFLELLLNLNKIDINITDKHGYTPLMVAVENGNFKAVNLLCSMSNNIHLSIKRNGYCYNMCNIPPLYKKNKIKSLLNAYKIQTGQ